MMPSKLQRATLDDYQNSIELDGSVTDHVQREAAAVFGVKYGSVTSRRKLATGARLWALRVMNLQGDLPPYHPNC